MKTTVITNSASRVLPWQQRILNGCELLDKSLGFNWAQGIDTLQFDIDSFNSCVLGQLFNGAFYDGLDRLGLTQETAREYGFYPFEGESTATNVIQLTKEKNQFWVKEIVRRRLLARW